jgi:hypothetical protein
MIHTLELENYRGFRRYKLADLARVNLLVGKNNSGKTSILEAVQILATRADFNVFAEIADQRDETFDELEERGTRRFLYLNLSHLVHGREIRLGTNFAIRADHSPGTVGLKLKTKPADEASLPGPRPGPPDATSRELSLYIEITRDEPELERREWPLGPLAKGGLLALNLLQTVSDLNEASLEVEPVRFIRQESLDRASMGAMWNDALMEGREEEVEEAMRILEPSLSRIVFLTGEQPRALTSERPRALPSQGGILLGFKGDHRRYPLGSFGEGMRRLLALALTLPTAKGVLVLIDEIDSGLHYSILEDLWLLVVETAKRLDIQVFATTHSSDCLRSLASLCARRPDLRKEVSVQKIERELDEAVAINAEQLQIAIEQEIEVR